VEAVSESSFTVLSLSLTALIHVVHLSFVVYLPFSFFFLFFSRIAMAFVFRFMAMAMAMVGNALI
jgi:hypothetical protein